MSIIRPESFEYTPAGGAPYLQYTAFDKSPCNRNRLACIVRLIEACGQGPKSILEIGCGNGNIAIPLASLGHRVKAIDTHGPSIEIAKGRNRFPRLQFEHVPLEQVDLRDFEIIVLTEVLEHVPRCGDMLEHISRGMRPDARMILTVPNGWGMAEFLLRPSYALKRWSWGARLVGGIKKALAARDLTTSNEQTPHVHFFTLGRLARLLEENGFSPIAFRRLFWAWALLETFLSQEKFPHSLAERDFHLSQHLPVRMCALWAFLLGKKAG